MHSVFLFQLNVSGCDCLPDDCDRANSTYELLTQSTAHCFLNGNIPINSVAQRIRNDAGHLHYIIKRLKREIHLKQDQSLENHNDLECSFDFAAIKVLITTDDEWCIY